jgi:1,2-diacylglycerol 3-alpha-glucosyltransferase
MRLLMISDVYFPRVNGVSTSIQTVGRELVAKGHQVTLITPSYGEATDDPFEVIRIPSRYLPFDPEDRIMRWGLLPGHRAALRAKRFDLVHIHTPFIAHYAGLALARWLALPVVESYHTFFEQYLDKYIPLVPGAWLRYAARRFSAAQCNDVDALAVPSQVMLDVLTRYGIQTPAEVVPDRHRSGAIQPRRRRPLSPALGHCPRAPDAGACWAPGLREELRLPAAHAGADQGRDLRHPAGHRR